MIRVLQMIGSLDIGGSQAMIMNLYRKIDRNQIQFDFILDHKDHLFFADEVKRLGGKIYFMPSFTGKNISEIKKAWKKFFSEHSEYKILHSHVRSYASIYIPIAKKHGLKTIIHSHSTSNGQGLSSVVKRILQFPLRYQADYFFGCSKEAGEWLFGKKVVQSDKYFMIKNAVDTEKFLYNQKTRDEYRNSLNIENKTVFFHVGRFHPAKNHMFLLEVFALYNKKYPESVLMLAGDGDLRTDIEKKINELDIRKSVLVLGNRNDVSDLMQAADCFLFPSLWEGLPVTVVEAQAAGLPCYISDKVTKDVEVSDLAHYLTIEKGSDVWTDMLFKEKFNRKNVTDKIKEKGFDICESTERLSVFYRGIINE